MGRIGKQTVNFPSAPRIEAYISVVGKKESEGPLGECFDVITKDAFLGEETWEKAESRLFETGYNSILQKAGISSGDINYIFAGDLLNQCTASAFGMKDCNVPYFGIFGACSTMAEGMTLAAMLTDGGFSEKSVAAAGSHFCSAEKQFRFPLEYGGQRRTL